MAWYEQVARSVSNATQSLNDVFFNDGESFQDAIEEAEAKSQQFSAYQDFMRDPDNREERYEQYDEMSKDSIMATVLRTYADDAFGIKNESGPDIWVSAESDEVAEKANDFIQELGIPEKVWGATLQLAKYGDEFWKVQGEKNEGVQNVEFDIHPSMFERWQKGGELVGFVFKTNPDKGRGGYGHQGGKQTKEVRPPWEAVHVRSGVHSQRQRISQEPQLREGGYGQSVFQNTLRDWKKLNMMEDSMVLNRYHKSRRPLMVYIDTTGVPDGQKKQYIEAMKNKVRTNEAFSKSQENFDQSSDLFSRSEPVMIPIEDGDGKILFEDQSESVSIESIIDVEHIQQKVYASFAIPSAFLGLEDQLPSGIGESSLISMSTRYARTIRRLKGEVLAGIKRLIRIHFAWKGEPIPANDFEVNSTSVTTAEDLTRAETASNIVNAMQTMTRVLSDLNEPPNRDDPPPFDLDKQAIAEFMVNRLNMPGLSSDVIFNTEDLEEEASDEQLQTMHEFFRERSELETRSDIQADVPSGTESDGEPVETVLSNRDRE